MRVAIIIPSNNRKQNLECVIESLKKQTVKPDELVIVDDRSTDETYRLLEKGIEGIQYKYVYNGVLTPGWNASTPRNLGARAVSKDIELLWFLDSDVVLPENAVELTKAAFLAGDPRRMLIGSYDWLPAQEVTAHDIKFNFDKVIAGQLPFKNIKKRGMIGQSDIRKVSFDKATTSQEMFSSFTDGLAAFGGYLLIKKDVFFMAGGYDESIGSGCEDGDFGITLYEMGVPFSYLKETKGYHLAHEQPDGREPVEIYKNVDKLNKKHNVDLIHQSGKAYRQWGIDWNPPPEFYDFDEQKLKQWKKDWEVDKLDFMMKITKQ